MGTVAGAGTRGVAGATGNRSQQVKDRGGGGGGGGGALDGRAGRSCVAAHPPGCRQVRGIQPGRPPPVGVEIGVVSIGCPWLP